MKMMTQNWIQTQKTQNFRWTMMTQPRPWKRQRSLSPLDEGHGLGGLVRGPWCPAYASYSPTGL